MFNTDIPVVWINYADNSYIISRMLFFTNFLLESPVNAHRTMELYLKAYLVSNSLEVSIKGKAWGHNLIELNNHCTKYDPSFNNTELIRRLKYFQRYFDLVRYPSSIEGKLTEGTGIWFSFESNVLPLDEVVAFIRPRVKLPQKEWKQTIINTKHSGELKKKLEELRGIYPTNNKHSSEKDEMDFQERALLASNDMLDYIVCKKTYKSDVKFDSKYHFDLPGC